MKQIMSKIGSLASVRDVGKLFSANVFAQLLGILIYPLLTRLYTPEDFGLLNLFGSIAGILIILSTLEWYNAIVLPKKDEDASSMVHLCGLSIAALTLLLIATIPLAEPIAAVFKSPQLAQYYWLIPIYVLLMGSWNVLNYWYIRHKAYSRISGYQISQSLFSAGYKAGLGAVPVVGGLIYATILSPLCALTLSISLAAKKYLKPLESWNWNSCRKVAKEYSNFPKFSTPRVLINSIATQLPILLLTPLFGNAAVGLLGMAFMLAFVPVNMLTHSLYQVFYQKTTELVQQRLPIYNYYKRFSWLAAGVIIVLQALLFLPLPTIVEWFLGDEWRLSGELIRWTFPWLLCYVLTFSTGYIPDIFGKQKTELYFEILLTILRVAGLGIGIWQNDFEMSFAGYVVGSAIGTGARFIWQMAVIKHYEDSLTPASSSTSIS